MDDIEAISRRTAVRIRGLDPEDKDWTDNVRRCVVAAIREAATKLRTQMISDSEALKLKDARIAELEAALASVYHTLQDEYDGAPDGACGWMVGPIMRCRSVFPDAVPPPQETP